MNNNNNNSYTLLEEDPSKTTNRWKKRFLLFFPIVVNVAAILVVLVMSEMNFDQLNDWQNSTLDFAFVLLINLVVYIIFHCCFDFRRSILIVLGSITYLALKVSSRVRSNEVENTTTLFWPCAGVFAFSIFVQLFCEFRFRKNDNSPVLMMTNSPRTVKSSHKRREIKSIQCLRFFAAMHIVMYHFFQSTTFSKWGASQLTFFFLLSGFVLSYQYRGRENEICTWRFFAKRLFRLYPTYLLSIAVQCVQLGTITSTRQLIIMLFSLQTWISDAFTNEINTPSWAIGAFLICYLLFPTTIRILSTLKSRKNILNAFLVLFIFSAWQALNAIGYRITIYSFPLSALFQAHVPSFLFGCVLGSHFVDSKLKSQNQAIPYMCIAVLLLIFTFVDVSSLPYIYAWSSNGLLLPIYGLLVWSVSANELNSEKKNVSSCLVITPLYELGRISFAVYILQTCVYTLVNKYMCFESMNCDALFVITLLWISFFVFHVFETPVVRFLVQLLELAGKVSALKKEETETEKMKSTPFMHDGSCLRNVLYAILYYILFVVTIGVYILVSIGGDWEEPIIVENSISRIVLNVLKWFAVLAIPALFFTTIGHIVYPAVVKKKFPSLREMVASDGFMDRKIRFRFVTRGRYPDLVSQNVRYADKVLKETCSELPTSMYCIEVATDRKMNLRDRCPGIDVTEIVVPDDYHVFDDKNIETKYKARALHFAIGNCGAHDNDWIVHLDEETRFDRRTVASILSHAIQQNARVSSGVASLHNIGQGCILYGTERVGPIQNYITTLADSIRVADDFGKFRLQYEGFNEPWIGMHGSFVVVSHKVERTIGFNAGLQGSITEDAHFALVARSQDVRFEWLDSNMYEASPFSLWDFICQRRRWYGGLWLVCKDPRIAFAQRFVLSMMTFTWAASFLVGIAIALCMLTDTDVGPSFKVMIVTVASTSCWGYVLGFVLTFRIEDGVIRYLTLLFLQLLLQPFFAVLEITGVCYAIISPPIEGFFIVQKETDAHRRNVNDDDDDDGSESSSMSSSSSSESLERLESKV